MKHFLTALMLFLASAASAQIVNIPDVKFKQYLVMNFDSNADGEIQVSEALAVTNIQIGLAYQYIHDYTGIQAFQNLEVFVSDDQWEAQNLDVSGMTSLKYLRAFGLCDIYPLPTAVNINGCINLEAIDLEASRTNLIYDNLPRLKTYKAGSLTRPELDLRNCDSLQYLFFDAGSIGRLRINGLTQLKRTGSDYGTVIDTLDAAGCITLKNAWFNSNSPEPKMFKVDFTGCSALDTLRLGRALIDSLDLSASINLRYLDLADSSQLKYLNIKNGSQLNHLFIKNNAALFTPLNICADDFEISDVLTSLSYITRPISISPYCSFASGGLYNTINGKVRIDLDMNGCDVNDGGMPNVPIRITDGTGNTVIRYSAPSGDYRHYPYAGNFTLEPYFPYTYFNIGLASTNIVFPTASSLIDSANFCISPTGVHNDLDITFLPVWGWPSPGFTSHYQLHYRNRGTTVLSGTVQLNYDAAKVNFNQSYPASATQAPGQATWNYTNLQPFQEGSIYVDLNIAPPPTNNFNDTLMFLATINPSAGDETPSNNSFILPQRLYGSYDPNDKQCLEGGKLEITDIGNYLHYVVHFQNEGNAPAFNVVVTDTLSNKLDWNSFDFISSSHPCHVKRVDNKLEFFFENINLTYASADEPGSHGFVAFNIKPKNNVLVGDSLNNKASIYFDFNLPIVTNTATTIVTSAAGPVPVKLEYFALNPKAKTNILTWKVSCTSSMATFNIERSEDGSHFNAIGSFSANELRCQSPFTYTDDKPLSGKNFYRIKITDADGISFYSKILVIGNKEGTQSMEILAVTVQQSNATVYLDNSISQTIQLKILAGDCKLISQSNKNIIAGRTTIDVPVKMLARGLYTLVVITGEGEIITRRFVN